MDYTARFPGLAARAGPVQQFLQAGGYSHPSSPHSQQLQATLGALLDRPAHVFYNGSLGRQLARETQEPGKNISGQCQHKI